VSRRKPKAAKDMSGAGPASAATVTVCRGCCCGTISKNPGTDHAGQLAQLRGELGRANVRISGCLDACERSNVMVISPSPDGRRRGGRPVWLGQVLQAEAVTDITAWLRAGGPGVSDPPAILDLSAFSPSRRVRGASGTE
jgi:(2Fe-2S) ferredoxin